MKHLALNKGHVALVDDDDFRLLQGQRWHAIQDKRGRRTYARRGFWIDGRQRKLLLQNYLMQPTSDQRVVFLDDDSLNCQRANLMLVACSRRDIGRDERLTPDVRPFAGRRAQSPGASKLESRDPLDEEYQA